MAKLLVLLSMNVALWQVNKLVFAIGWIQSKKKFCLAYGFMGVFNFGKSGQMQKALSKDDQAADRATAFSILGQSVVLAFAITGLIYFLPL